RLLRMVAGLLADEDPFGVAPRTLQDLIRHQPVVEDHVGLLQELQRAQREEIRIARSRSDDVDLARPTAGAGRPAPCAAELPGEAALGRGLLAGENLAGGASVDEALPECAAPGRCKRALDGCASLTEKASERPE